MLASSFFFGRVREKREKERKVVLNETYALIKQFKSTFVTEQYLSYSKF